MIRLTSYFLIAAVCIMASFLTVNLGRDSIQAVNIEDTGSEFEQADKKVHELIENASSLNEKASVVKEDLKEISKMAYSGPYEGEDASRGGYYRKNYIDMKLDQKCGYSKSQLEKMVKGTPLEGIGEYVLAAEHIYGVNALFIVSLAQHESGNGMSRLARSKNNLFGLGAYDSSPYESAITYSSKEECIMYFAKMINSRYFGKGHRTLRKIGSRYASDQDWPEIVAKAMKLNEQKALK